MPGEIAALVSGGVDSSVALERLVVEDGARVTAFYVKIWLEDEMAFMGRCPWEDDLRYVRSVCRQLDVPLEVVSLQREYFDRVVAEVVAELRAGHTPSPDVLCNRRIKFGSFLDRVGATFDRVASGHYARRDPRPDGIHLLKGVDAVKDQTYFLCQLDQNQLERTLFPIGDLGKAEVRARARQSGLATADRPDSQGVCFLGRLPYDDFIRFHLGELPGPIREHETGRRLGTHRGPWFHTIGQRRGLGLAGGPWYVVDKDMAQNVVWVTHANNLGHHRRRRFIVPEPRWLCAAPTREDLEIRVRHGAAIARARVLALATGSLEVELEDGDPGLAPGQFAVVYDGDECLGGGTIGTTLP